MRQKSSNEFGHKIDFIVETFQANLNRQSESLTTLHTKVNYMLAFASLLTAGLLGVLVENKFQCALEFKIGLIGLLLCEICLLIAARNRVFIDPPAPETIYSQKAFNLELSALKNQVASDMKLAYEKNTNQLRSIAKWLNRAMIIFTVSLIIIIIPALFLPTCAKIGFMSSNPQTDNSKQQPSPVPPSQSIGTPVIKSPNSPSTPTPIPPSPSVGTALPFSENSTFSSSNKKLGE